MTQGFSVVDVETTGFSYGSHDRVVEVAVVHVDPAGQIEGQWETLINPGRDIGPQNIHGVTGREIRRAPLFADVAGKLADLLRGRVFVAHNVAFDSRFIAAEFRRVGINVPLPSSSSLCTMQLASRYLPSAGARSLAGCCDAMGVIISQQHRASADAQAAAQLLAGYLRVRPTDPAWPTALEAASGEPWPTIPGTDTVWISREAADKPQAHFLTRLVTKIADLGEPDSNDENERTYLAMLDGALLDRDISASESDALVALAGALSLDRSHAEYLHRRYLEALVAAAWADGVMTDLELTDLGLVAKLLSVPEADLGRLIEEEAHGSMGTPPPPLFDAFHLDRGDLVVFTGDMLREREEWEHDAIAAGLIPWQSVTKKVKLVIAADPDSLSVKAKKARAYGIPIVTEAAFVDILGQLQERPTA